MIGEINFLENSKVKCFKCRFVKQSRNGKIKHNCGVNNQPTNYIQLLKDCPIFKTEK